MARLPGDRRPIEFIIRQMRRFRGALVIRCGCVFTEAEVTPVFSLEVSRQISLFWIPSRRRKRRLRQRWTAPDLPLPGI